MEVTEGKGTIDKPYILGVANDGEQGNETED
jgi:hypothetical protein